MTRTFQTVSSQLLATVSGGLYDGYHSPDGDSFTDQNGQTYTWAPAKPQWRSSYPGGIPPFGYTVDPRNARTMIPMSPDELYSRPEWGGMVGE